MERDKEQETATKDSWDALKHLLDEHMPAYQLVGYTAEGQRVFMSSAQNPMQYDAINELVERSASGCFPSCFA